MFSRKITDNAVLGFKLSEERLYKKVPVCVRSISMLIASNTRRDFRMSCLDRALGSENFNLRLFPRSFHTNQPDLDWQGVLIYMANLGEVLSFYSLLCDMKLV